MEDKPKVYTQLEYFDNARVVLMREVNRHSSLIERLQHYDPETQFPEMLGEIAAELNILVEGMYMPAELDKLCEMCYWKLKHRRNIKLR